MRVYTILNLALAMSIGWLTALALPGQVAPPALPAPKKAPPEKMPEELPVPLIIANPCPEDGKKAPESRRALGILRVGNGQCTGTVTLPQEASGRYLILTASHCIRKGQRGTFKLSDGRVVAVTCVSWDNTPDVAWLRTDEPLSTGLPAARLAMAPAQPGQKVWHAGFGIDKPGNVEEGICAALPDRDGQSRYRISVSPGDSGGGIFSAGTGELFSPVCCTTCLACLGDVWAGGPVECARLRPGGNPGARVPAEWVRSDVIGHPETAIVPMLHLAGRRGDHK